jgi:hypothetical protein
LTEFALRQNADRVPLHGGIPFGALLRLRADFVNPTNWTAQAQALARPMQRYGLYVADIGSNLYLQGEPSAHGTRRPSPSCRRCR